jgi:Putative homoserine kinase type II (protein kinase fold)
MQSIQKNTPERVALLIPSATLVGIDIQNEFGPIPPVLIPLFGKIALQKIAATFSGFDPVIYVGLNEQREMVHQYMAFFPCEQVHLVDVTSSVSISETIEQIINENTGILSGPALINFADTVVNDLDPALIGHDFVAYSICDESERWTLFKETGGIITDHSDKQFQLDPSGWKTFIGLWGVRDTKRFYEILKKWNRRDRITAFYKTIIEYYNTSSRVEFVYSKDWFDLGHIDNYYRARRRNINTRFFNSTNVNEKGYGIVKTSTNTSKIIHEITWYLNLPKELRYHIPTLYEYSCDTCHPYYEMEYYSYPTLDDCFISGRFDFDTWNKIFLKIFCYIKSAAKYNLGNNDLHRDLVEMYHDKTLTRLEQYLRDTDPKFIHELDALTINGKKLLPLKDFILRFDRLLERFHIFDSGEFQVIHGDLCFGNILFDHKNGIIKFIDPRGEFGRHTIYGDIYYDLGKLSHSVLGFYDCIIFNQYRLNRIGVGQYTLEFFRKDYKEVVGKIFTKYLRVGHYDPEKVRFVEALHFLSMLPLHADTPNRQKVLLFRGLQILSELLEETP